MAAAQPRILAFAGSTRKDSVNKKLVRIAAQGATDAGALVAFIDLKDLPLPLFDEDLEAQQGHPDACKQLKKLLIESDGFLIASPEYNSSISAALKNAIDWASRPAPNEAPLAAFKGKVAGIMAASPGGLGGIRGLVHLRSILGNIGVIVLPEQATLPGAFEAFGPDGKLKDAKKQATVADLGKAVAHTAAKLKA